MLCDENMCHTVVSLIVGGLFLYTKNLFSDLTNIHLLISNNYCINDAIDFGFLKKFFF